ncbi:MAG TPA: hypothetical protein VGN83_17965 [Falsiroseomonas sp.]|jgi:hypothetical protein|nr:hypothetical protein [Falsiroseomonas sp.]
MPDAKPELEIAALLRRAGYDLPPGRLPDDLDHAHGLLRRMLALLGSPAPEAEPATTFHPEASR